MRCSCPKKPWIRNELLRIFLAEFLGTFVLLTIGNSTVAHATLFPHGAGVLCIDWGYALAVGFGIYISFNASGGHVNPAITTGFAVLGLVSWKRIPLYYLAQILGAFAASPVVYGLHYEVLNNFDGGNRTVTGSTATGAIFFVYPHHPDVSIWSSLGQTVIATAIFLICVAAIVDERNAHPNTGMIPFFVATIVFVCGLAFGGTCLNPARDLGPRLFTAVAGWGVDVFKHRNYWFVVPAVGPLLGSIVGAGAYMLFVERHWPTKEYAITNEAGKEAYAMEASTIAGNHAGDECDEDARL